MNFDIKEETMNGTTDNTVEFIGNGRDEFEVTENGLKEEKELRKHFD